jgi:molecular chaperone HtpG
LTKRVLDMLGKLATGEPEKYATFWEQFGAALKEGLAEDTANRDRLAKLLRFSSTRSADGAQDRSLEAYIADATPEQKKIYYLITDSVASGLSSPHLEIFREKGIEVMLLTDRLDEWLLQHLTEFDGRELRDIARGELDLPATDEPTVVDAEPDKDEKDLLKRLKRALRDEVDEVRSAKRLRDSAACLVLKEADIGYQMRELMKAAGQEMPAAKPDLEVNLRHPLLQRLADEKDADKFDRLSSFVYEQAVLAEGRPLDDPGGFVRRMNELFFAG